MNYEELKVAQLKDELTKRGLSTTGAKAVLKDRLLADDEVRDRENGIITVWFRSIMGSFTTVKISGNITGRELIDAFIEKTNGLYTADGIYVKFDENPIDLNIPISEQGIFDKCTLSFWVRLVGKK